MGIVSALVLFAVIWFMVLFIMLPVGLKTQGDEDEVVPGTHQSAPANFSFRRKARVVTLISAGLWMVIAGVIFSGWTTLDDLEWFTQVRESLI